MKKIFKFIERPVFIIGIIFIIYCIYLSSSILLRGDIGFNTDLARDFLLLEDAVNNHKLPLIGPRSGGIPGIFHGPLWLYINLPAYIIGNGNPVVVGYFWIMLITFLIIITYIVGKSVYNSWIGLVAAILVSVNSIYSSSSLFNPFGAVLLAPLFIYFYYRFILSKKIKYILFALLIIGMIVQFQIAFGGPLLILTLILTLYIAIKRRDIKPIISFLVLLLPFSTYILFEVRHSFLQFHSLVSFISGKTGTVNNFSFRDLLQNRYDAIINSLVSIQYPPNWIKILITSLFVYILIKSIKTSNIYSKFNLLILYFFSGYWIISFLFKGVIWSYYYWPFMPISMLFIASSIKYINKYIYFILISLLLYVSYTNANNTLSYQLKEFVGKDSGSWLFNYNLAKKVFSNNDNEFGYYIFSPDQYGYSPKYAMDYVSRSYKNINIFPYQKRKITYLIISPPGGELNSIGGDWWKENRININSKPIKLDSFSNGFTIEKYILSDNEVKISSDQNLIDTLIFR